MSKIDGLKPVLKWVGGKRQLLNEIIPIIPEHSSYFEPFLGGGAVLFSLQPSIAYVNDFNSELIGVYKEIKKDPEALIELLEVHSKNNSSEYFYKIREMDRDLDVYGMLSELEKAARIIYLNKTCYNGLFRVNRSGQFNTPYGRYKNPDIESKETIRSLSKYFNANNIIFENSDFSIILKNVDENSFVYLDPPYMPVSSSSSFTGYTEHGFGVTEQKRLKLECDRLDSLNAKFLQSNSDTPFIRELYKDYNIITIKARRSINSKASSRGEINEVLIFNYETDN